MRDQDRRPPPGSARAEGPALPRTEVPSGVFVPTKVQGRRRSARMALPSGHGSSLCPLRQGPLVPSFVSFRERRMEQSSDRPALTPSACSSDTTFSTTPSPSLQSTWIRPKRPVANSCTCKTMTWSPLSRLRSRVMLAAARTCRAGSWEAASTGRRSSPAKLKAASGHQGPIRSAAGRRAVG